MKYIYFTPSLCIKHSKTYEDTLASISAVSHDSCDMNAYQMCKIAICDCRGFKTAYIWVIKMPVEDNLLMYVFAYRCFIWLYGRAREQMKARVGGLFLFPSWVRTQWRIGVLWSGVFICTRMSAWTLWIPDYPQCQCPLKGHGRNPVTVYPCIGLTQGEETACSAFRSFQVGENKTQWRNGRRLSQIPRNNYRDINRVYQTAPGRLRGPRPREPQNSPQNLSNKSGQILFVPQRHKENWSFSVRPIITWLSC